MCQDTVSPAPTARMSAASGPTTGMISRIPVAIPISSQYGSPTKLRAIDASVVTKAIRISWPRTNAPSFWSISVHVSRTVFRFGRGSRPVTRSTVRSRSKIQYAATANVKRMPTTTLIACSPIDSAG